MARKGGNDDSLQEDPLEQNAETLPHLERYSESKGSAVKRKTLLPEPTYCAKKLKTQVTVEYRSSQSLELKDNPNDRIQHTSLCELPKPKQDKHLGDYLIKAVKEIQQMEDTCRKKRHSILALKERISLLTRAQQNMITANLASLPDHYFLTREMPRKSNSQYGYDGSLGYHFGEFDNLDNADPSIVYEDRIPDLCPIVSVTSQNDVMCISDKAGDMQTINIKNQTNQLVDKPQERVTWFPEYIDMSSSTTTEDHDKIVQYYSPHNETMSNSNSCMHVSVIKTM